MSWKSKQSKKGYVVDRVLDIKLLQGRRFYLVKWKNFSEEENTWEPLNNLIPIATELLTFEEENKEQIEKIEREWLRLY